MNLRAFKKELKNLVEKDGWKPYLDGRNQVRFHPPNQKTCYCPITAIAKKLTGRTYPILDAFYAAPLIQLEDICAKNIMRAADKPIEEQWGGKDTKPLRRWIFKSFQLDTSKL